MPPFFVPPGIPSVEYDKNPIKIIVPFYNAAAYIERSMLSALTQKYENFKIIFIDDASTDGSWEKLPHDDPRAICIRNETNVTALPNIHRAIMEYCDPNDIVVLLDGDDWLPNNKVLKYINEYYCQNDCWIMYGQATWSTGQKGCASEYTKEEFDHLRMAPFRVSHIRTFRTWLYHKIKEQDPEFSCMKDKSGNWYRMTYDVAIMFPIMEMAGFDKIKYNDKPLYIYNFENPRSDHRVNQQLQWDIHKEIANKIPFKKIESMLKENIFKNYKNKYFVETGSHNGDGIQKAIEAGFENIISIELSDKYFDRCVQRFKDNKNVTIIKGDSALVLNDVIKDINCSITFWLDGHYSCGDTACGAYRIPLIQELEQIKKHKIKNHTILIDDMRCWKEPNEVHGFYEKDIFDKIKEFDTKYNFSFVDGSEKDDILVCKPKYKIGLLVIATGKYDKFVPPLLKSMKEHFLKNQDVTMFVFSDKEIPTQDGLKVIQQEHEGWPNATLKRYHIFSKNKDILSQMDYLFYCDADMLFTADVGDEVLGDLVATIHPGFFDQGRNSYTYEGRKESTAYIALNEGKKYYAGGFNGGTSSKFLEMSEQIKNNVDIDFSNNIIAIWHDESHLNRYLVNNEPTVALSPSYCYPESWNIPFEKRLLALDKNHSEIRQ